MDQHIQDDLFRLLYNEVAQKVGALKADQGLADQVLIKPLLRPEGWAPVEGSLLRPEGSVVAV